MVDAPQFAVDSYIVDFAELFILFHEIQHQMPLSKIGLQKLGVKTHLPPQLQISPKRAKWWTAELDHDANSMWLLLLSATSVFHEKHGMTLDDAKVQAGSLVGPGADAALHALQCLEEMRYGPVDLATAATSGDFVRHPPSTLRRNSLSLVAYSTITGKDITSLYRREFTEGWQIVANNVASRMQVQERLLSAYQIWRNSEG
jgi:hypothetical protein